MASKTTKVIGVRFRVEEIEELEGLAEEHGVLVSELIRLIVRDYLKNRDKRKSFWEKVASFGELLSFRRRPPAR